MPSLTEQSAPHNAQKYEAVLEQAIRAFAEQGFRNTDVQVIADKAGVGKGTVYRYFGNKEDLFWAACFSVLERLGKHLIDSMADCGSAVETLRRAGVAHAAFFEANPHYLEVFVQNRAEFRGSVPQAHKDFHERLVQVFVEVVERGIAEGEIRPLDPRRTITSMSSVFYGTVHFACYVRDRYTLSDLAQHTLDVFLDGICADRAKAEREVTS